MLRRFLEWLAGRWLPRPQRIMGEGNSVYLERWLILPPPRSRGLTRLWRFLFGDRALFLHHFCRADEYGQLHDHPWDVSYSLMLAGWYDEDRLVRPSKIVTRRRTAGAITRVDGGTVHRLDAISPGGTWTLFLVGRRVKPWGFFTLITGNAERCAEFIYKVWQGSGDD